MSNLKWLSLREWKRDLPWDAFDGCEIRADLMKAPPWKEIQTYCRTKKKKLLWTHLAVKDLKGVQEGWIDCPWGSPLIDYVEAERRVLSWHDFEKTPDDLNAIFHLLKRVPAKAYKIATTASCTTDALRLLLFLKIHANEPLTGIAMGSLGKITRRMGPILGNSWSYCALPGEETAPGQLSVEEKALDKKTQFTFLLGNPVSESRSDQFYNDYYQEKQLSYFHEKLLIEKRELQTVLKLLWELPVVGGNITMPFKEAVFPEQGAVNCLERGEEGWVGFNSDALAMYDLLKDYRGKHALLLGAGGVAWAALWAMQKLQMRVTCINRSYRSLLEAPGIEGFLRDQVTMREYDVLVNATAVGMGKEGGLPCHEKEVLPGKIVFDLVYSPRYTPLLQLATQRGCQTIDGEQLFCRQALYFFHRVVEKRRKDEGT